QGFGSLGRMASVLMTPDGKPLEAEAAHGTVTSHFRQHRAGTPASTNPIASILASTLIPMLLVKVDITTDVLWFDEALDSVFIQAVKAEAAHGTVTRHFLQHQAGKPPSTNPIASIFAWTRGLMHR
ncbi:isocitrate/isopropylmalate family dehydrogenase, partial [Nocardia sp. NRRL S-836]|uniref:isocitrate/isopropylmalate family dehydrogenase n=1 Tax=Nocardia sp. NRRL S-836 TaxID=1519492 RepID=UPI0006C66673